VEVKAPTARAGVRGDRTYFRTRKPTTTGRNAKQNVSDDALVFPRNRKLLEVCRQPETPDDVAPLSSHGRRSELDARDASAHVFDRHGRASRAHSRASPETARPTRWSPRPRRPVPDAPPLSRRARALAPPRAPR
jgi:hypothetical protein